MSRDRAAARAERDALRDGGRRTPLRRPPRPHRPRPQLRRGRIAAVAVAGIAIVAVGWLLVSLYQPFAGDATGSVPVVVPKGASVGNIGDLLERRGVISSSFFFQARARVSGKAGELKPGSYRLRKDMTYSSALDVLAAGPPANIVNLTIPEGRSRREVAKLVPRSIRGGYLAATKRSPALNPRRYRAPRRASLEGFLFPATYELRKGRPVRVLVEKQLATFKRQFGAVDLRYARRKNLTPYDVLIVASMVEREAQLPRERKIIASVIYNRLHAHMHLGIDATVRYWFNNWERPLTTSELQTPSPYNTYLRPGLPAGPIGSPGLAAIQAAAHPARTRYRYYVVKPGRCGEHAFSATDAQFQHDSTRYNRARARRGGRSPTNC